MSNSSLAWQVINSLKARLVASSLLFILVLLPLIGVGLNDAFTEQVKSAAKNELSAYVYSILAVTEVENTQISIPELVLENRFNLIQSALRHSNHTRSQWQTKYCMAFTIFYGHHSSGIFYDSRHGQKYI